VARSVLAAVKSRHALTIVDMGAAPTEAGLIAAEMATTLLVVTTPDVPALRGVKRTKDLWRRLQVREDDDAVVVLNRTSRKLEVQPDLARKVVGGKMAEQTIPANFAALEEAANTGTPERLQDGKMREAFDALAQEVGAIPDAGAQVPAADNGPPAARGLLARLGGERGAASIEFTGILPFLVVFLLGIWQLGMVGYTYILAGHAAREGSRQLAVIPDDPKRTEPAYRKVARQDIPKAWRRKAEITKSGTSTVRVSLRVPVVVPGLKSPFRVTTQASTVVESEPLPPSQSRFGL
jgi:pilus assembly protein CpaE